MDARRLDRKRLTELRKRAVMSVQRGESPEVVARVLQVIPSCIQRHIEAATRSRRRRTRLYVKESDKEPTKMWRRRRLGISRQAMYGWLARYREGGWGSLDARKRGGRPPKLDGPAMKWVYNTVTMKNPLQLKCPFALWTSKMIGQAISKHLGITLSKASVCRLLNRLGLSPQRPLWRAYQQNPESVEKWLSEEYPRIKELAKTMKARIYFGDEAGIGSDHHAGTTWGVKPVVTSTGSRFGLNMISAVAAKGEFRFMVVNGHVNAPQFLEFIKRLVHNADRPVFLIVDSHPVHRAKSIKTFAEENKDRFRLFHLPPYSPELKPR